MQQRDKLVTAITTLDAHVVGVIEIENNSTDVPISDLVDGLNAATAPGTYAYVSTGPIGTDAIRVGLIYQPASVTPFNAFAVLDSSVDPLFIDDLNRPVLAQSFSENTSGVVFTVAVNHLKSKGSNCNGVGDPDMGDGQGNCNGVRTAAAAALVDWLATDPTESDSDDFLIIGDLNAYSQEDPVTTIESASYIDLIELFVGTGLRGQCILVQLRQRIGLFGSCAGKSRHGGERNRCSGLAYQRGRAAGARLQRLQPAVTLQPR